MLTRTAYCRQDNLVDFSSPEQPVPLSCPRCGSPRTRIVEIDVRARQVTIACADCGETSAGVNY